MPDRAVWPDVEARIELRQTLDAAAALPDAYREPLLLAASGVGFDEIRRDSLGSAPTPARCSRPSRAPEARRRRRHRREEADMKITEDVMNDLLTLQLTGEASADTRLLIESYARENPAFAARLEAVARPIAFESAAGGLSFDRELRVLAETRQFIFLRTILRCRGGAVQPGAVHVHVGKRRRALPSARPLPRPGVVVVEPGGRIVGSGLYVLTRRIRHVGL